MLVGNGLDTEHNINNSNVRTPYTWYKYFYETNITFKQMDFNLFFIKYNVCKPCYTNVLNNNWVKFF